MWDKYNIPESERKISIYPILCYYNGQEIPERLKNIPNVQIFVEPTAKKFESPLSREGCLIPLNEFMFLFKAGPDYFGFKTIIEESPFLLNSQVGSIMISTIYQALDIERAINVIKEQADTKTDIYKKENLIESTHQLIREVYNKIFNMNDIDYKKALIYIITKFDTIAKENKLTVQHSDYEKMTILQLINVLENHIDTNNENSLVKGILEKEITENSYRLDDGINHQNYTYKTYYKPGWAIGKLLVSTLSRRQLLGSRLDFEKFFPIFHHIIYKKWPLSFEDAVNKFCQINEKDISNIFHLQIQDGEADDMSYKIIGTFINKQYNIFRFFSTWQISTGGDRKNELFDYIQNCNSELRTFMQDDPFFVDPDSTNQNAVFDSLSNLESYLTLIKLLD